MRWKLAALGTALVGAVGAAPVVVAQQPGDPADGHKLANQFCRSCHLVSPDQSGPVPDGVISFMAMASRPELTDTRIEAAMLKPPHPAMPDPPLSQQQMRDVAAYILSFKPKT